MLIKLEVLLSIGIRDNTGAWWILKAGKYIAEDQPGERSGSLYLFDADSSWNKRPFGIGSVGVFEVDAWLYGGKALRVTS